MNLLLKKEVLQFLPSFHSSDILIHNNPSKEYFLLELYLYL